MANYAVVIGINSYQASRFPTLGRPVGDAIRMAEWLLDPANTEYGVEEGNLVLLLGPRDDAALEPILGAMNRPPEGLKKVRDLLKGLGGDLRAAGSDEIKKALRDIHGRMGGQGGRLYFYYSGHGLSTVIKEAVGSVVVDAVVPADYDLSSEKWPISIPSIVTALLATGCREQFFFFDCCRNQLPDEEVASVGRLRPDRWRVPTDQYVYNATALGLKAEAGEGLFSDLLFEGLGGGGAAKAYRPESGRYEVSASRLFRYVQKRLEDEARSLPRLRRLGGDHGDALLKTLDAVPDVTFRVGVEAPATVATGTKVAEARLLGDGLPAELSREMTAGAAVDFKLSPRLYFARVVPEPGLSGPSPRALEVYDDPFEHGVKLESVAAGSVAAASGGATEATTVVEPSREVLASLAAPTRGMAAPAAVAISADDPMVPIELLDSAGSPARDSSGVPLVGVGRLDCQGLPPGVYRARTRAPEGDGVETVFALGSGRNEPIRLQPPRVAASGLARRLTQAIEPGSPLDRLVQAAGRVESAVAPAASTLIALAGRAKGRGAHWKSVAKRLGDSHLGRLLHRDEDAPEGIRLFVGGEVVVPGPGRLVDPALAARLSTLEGVAAYLEELEARVWPLDGEPGEALRLRRVEGVAAMASIAWVLKPGPYRLSIGGPMHGTTVFELVVLEDRATDLIAYQGEDGRVDVSLFMPAGWSDVPPEPDEVRLIDMLQRFLRGDDVRIAAAVAERLLRLPLAAAALEPIAGALDPIAGALAGLALLRGGRLDALTELAERMTVHHPGAPDGHALLGLARMQRGDADAARAAFRDCLARGLPMLAMPLRATREAVETLAITPAEAPRAPLLAPAADALLPGALWSARRPLAAAAGR